MTRRIEDAGVVGIAPAEETVGEEQLTEAVEVGTVGVQRLATPSSWYPRVKQLMLESMPYLSARLGAQSATMPGAWQYLPSYPFTQASMPVEGLGAQRLYTPASWLPDVKAMQRVGRGDPYAYGRRAGSLEPWQKISILKPQYAKQGSQYQQAAPQRTAYVEPYVQAQQAAPQPHTFQPGASAPRSTAPPITATMQVSPQPQAVQMSTPRQAAPQTVPMSDGGRTGQSLILPKRAASEFSHASASRYPFAWAAIGQSLLEYKTTQPSYLPGQQALVEHVTHSEPTGPQPSQYARQITATAPSAPAYQQAALQTPQAPQASRVAPPAAQAARQMQQPAFSAVTPASASRGSQQVSPRVGQGLVEDRILPPQGQGEFVDTYYLEQFRRQKSALRGPAGISDGLADLAGPSGTLGAGDKKLVCAWLPDQCQDFDQHTAEAQNGLTAAAKQSRDGYFKALQDMKSGGGCDATVPGRLAGQLREHLLENGGDVNQLGAEEDTFGPKEMAEWIRVFGAEPTYADAKGAVGTKAVWPSNGWPINLDTICGEANTKLPTKTVTPGPAPPPPPTTKTAGKKKSKAGWLLLAGSAVTALFYAMK